jgi:hypothetical protein
MQFSSLPPPNNKSLNPPLSLAFRLRLAVAVLVSRGTMGAMGLCQETLTKNLRCGLV